MPFAVGETVGPYQIVDQLGQGGMATVFKAYHPVLDRYVAIKALHPAFTVESNFLTRFQREAQVIAKLEHPNIVPVYDFAEHERRPYLVLKFIEGDTLKARMSHAPLEPSEISEIVESVGAALDHAHRQGVLHRDVKPSNVLLSDDGRIYLADFGLARIAQAGESTISSDIMLGTPQYISPEQAMGQRDLDGGTDIYSFGVMIFEMLLGRVPYNADTPYSIIHDHIYAPLPIPHTIKSDIPEPVERVLLKALAKDRADRYSDVGAMVDAWKRAVQSDSSTRPVVLVGNNDDTGMIGDIPQIIEEREVSPVAESKAHSRSLPTPEIQTSSDVSVALGNRGRLWLGLSGLLLACCLCLVGAFVISPQLRGRINRILAYEGIPTQAQSVGAGSVTLPPHPPDAAHGGPADGLSSQLPDHAGSIEEAKSRIAAEPGDPYAYLDLAVAYWDQNMYVDAEVAYGAALERAGNDSEFYLRAGDITLGRQMWLEAARMYLDAARLMKDAAPPELQEKLRQALYLASGAPKADILLDDLPGSHIPPDFVTVLQARRALKQGQTERAIAMVRRLGERQPSLKELQLLEAEIAVAEGQDERARSELEKLVSDPAMPQWIRLVADYILREVNSGE